MAPTFGSPRLSRISIFYLLASAFPSVYASTLFARQDSTCGGKSGFEQCGTGFPSSFCCPTSTTCMSLKSTSVQSVICCPAGSDCAFITPITCDVSQLNATLHPDNQIHLSDTNGVTLPTCGDKCCPLGYTCNGGTMCSKDSTTTSPSSTSTTQPTPSATNGASASQTSGCPVPAAAQTQQGFNGSSFAAGLFPGLLIGALGAIGFLWLIRKRRESQAKSRYSGDFGHVARQISDPIYDPERAARTDFMRRGSQSAQNSPNSTDRIIQGMKETQNRGGVGAVGGITPRIKSMWDRTPKLNFGFATGLPSNPAPSAHPPAIRAGNASTDPYTTPRQKPKRIHSARRTSSRRASAQRPDVARAGSTETIDVLMPAPSFLAPPMAMGMRENRFTSDSSNTTFTKLMERAGFDEGGREEVREWNRTPRRI